MGRIPVLLVKCLKLFPSSSLGELHMGRKRGGNRRVQAFGGTSNQRSKDKSGKKEVIQWGGAGCIIVVGSFDATQVVMKSVLQKTQEALYLCSTKTREVLGNPSLTPEIFREQSLREILRVEGNL